jgi:hypothetical protein
LSGQSFGYLPIHLTNHLPGRLARHGIATEQGGLFCIRAQWNSPRGGFRMLAWHTAINGM